MLESQLLRSPRLLRLILIHEIFHFVWVRLGNMKRAEYTYLLEGEHRNGARGEVGESAQVKKELRPVPGTAVWRDYVCESFADTAAHVYAGFNRHTSFALAKRWIARRREWFETTFVDGCRC